MNALKLHVLRATFETHFRERLFENLYEIRVSKVDKNEHESKI